MKNLNLSFVSQYLDAGEHCSNGKIFSACVPSCRKTCANKLAEEVCLLEDKKCQAGK